MSYPVSGNKVERHSIYVSNRAFHIIKRWADEQKRTIAAVVDRMVSIEVAREQVRSEDDKRDSANQG